jgi:hypothetical protein
MTDPANYTYDIKIGHGADILKQGPFSLSFEKCGEMIITSKQFLSYDECEKSLSCLMSTLSYLEAKFSAKSHVIVTKLNPVLDATGKKHTDSDTWDKQTVLRAYIADAEALKGSKLNYHVSGQIKVDQIILGLKPKSEST